MLTKITQLSGPLLAIGCIAISTICYAPKAAEASEDWFDQRLAVMIDPQASFSDRCQAEDELRGKPAVAALPKLLPLLDKFVRDPRCGTRRAHDSDLKMRAASSRWDTESQIDHAVNRLWYWTIEKTDQGDLNRQVASLLIAIPKDEKDSGTRAVRLLMALDSRWSDESEAAVRIIYDDKSNVAWWTALRVLALNSKTSLREDIHRILNENDTPSVFCDLINLVGSERYKARWGTDQTLREQGFKKLLNLPLESRSEILHALNLVVALQGLVNETFLPPFTSTGDEPEQVRKARQQVHELESIARAKHWWAMNK